MRYLAISCAALLAASCGKKSQDSAAKSSPATAGGSSAAAPASPPAASGSTAWIALDPLPVEADLPSCAKADAAGSDESTVIAAGGPGCQSLALGVHDMHDATETLDDRVKVITNGIATNVTRKDKTPNGWVIEYERTDQGNTSPTLGVVVQYKSFQCLGDSLVPAEAAAQRHACESMRDKK